MDFHFDKETVRYYLEGGCGLLALKLKSFLSEEWKIYGIGLKDFPPAHYVMRLPTAKLLVGNHYLDITGIKPESYHIDYWKNYFIQEGESDPEIVVQPVDSNLSNDDYYQDIICDLDKEQLKKVVRRILQRLRKLR
jgi:hypothetical protein